VNESVIETGRIIIATGARPLVPKKWEAFSDRILTSENIFEQESIPERLAVIGLGPVGLELGQALSRIGAAVTGFDMVDQIGGLTDPEVNASAVKAFSDEFPLFLGETAEIEQAGEELVVRAGDDEVRVDKLLLAMGVRPNIDGLGLDALGLVSPDGGVKGFDPTTGQLCDSPVFMAGDVDGDRAILHEALDDGFIAGNNAVSDEVACYQRRPILRMVFSDPELFVVGSSFDELEEEETVVGKVSFQDQSRAVMQGSNKGLLRLYADKTTARILGAEGAGPDAEHLGHLLALAIHRESTVFDMLQMPFYHPTIEEGLQTALEDAADRLPSQHRPPELSLCQSRPEDILC
jgi:dihydrolipoamide dehydrogenase